MEVEGYNIKVTGHKGGHSRRGGHLSNRNKGEGKMMVNPLPSVRFFFLSESKKGIKRRMQVKNRDRNREKYYEDEKYR